MPYTPQQEEALDRIKEARAQAVEHFLKAKEASARRSDLMLALIKDGVSQSDIARELGVTRQAIKKMIKTR
ncbi:MAG TPA: helix-turn-helix domain-containing protein [Mycobacteriales bacterium]